MYTASCSFWMGVIPLPLKNDKTHLITPARLVIDVLKEQYRQQHEWRFRAQDTWQDGNFVFTDELGGHLPRSTTYHQFKAVVKSMGLSETRLHDLRHSYAVASLQAGDDVKTVQENLGHHTAAFTLDTYAHVTERMKQESAARMNAFIQRLKQGS